MPEQELLEQARLARLSAIVKRKAIKESAKRARAATERCKRNTPVVRESRSRSRAQGAPELRQVKRLSVHMSSTELGVTSSDSAGQVNRALLALLAHPCGSRFANLIFHSAKAPPQSLSLWKAIALGAIPAVDGGDDGGVVILTVVLMVVDGWMGVWVCKWVSGWPGLCGQIGW